MFISFFLLLKQSGLKVSLKEFLILLEALENQKTAPITTHEFYEISRLILIKSESDYDLFDQVFTMYIAEIEKIPDQLAFKIPEEWLKKNSEKFLSQEEKELLKSIGGPEELLERFKKLLEEQKERHEGGSKWIGTGGTSPFGAYGYNPEGYRIGQEGSRHRKAIKVWDERNFQNLRKDVELNTRNMKMALRQLRIFAREGKKKEFDLEGTISKTSRNAGFLEIIEQSEKKNNIKVLLLIDSGGSMDPYIKLCERMFSACHSEFKHIEYYYFHNCVYEKLWKNNERRWSEFFPTQQLLNTFSEDYKVIFIGDASMSPYELVYAGGSVEHYNKESGAFWLQKLINKFKDVIWINPEDEKMWKYYETIFHIKKLMGNRMFPMTIEGLELGIKTLKSKNNITFH